MAWPLFSRVFLRVGLGPTVVGLIRIGYGGRGKSARVDHGIHRHLYQAVGEGNRDPHGCLLEAPDVGTLDKWDVCRISDHERGHLHVLLQLVAGH